MKLWQLLPITKNLLKTLTTKIRISEQFGGQILRELSSGKSMRIYEIAKELGVSSKEVLAFLKKSGIECSSHMTVLTDDSVQKIKKNFVKTLLESKVVKPNQHETVSQHKKVKHEDAEKVVMQKAEVGPKAASLNKGVSINDGAVLQSHVGIDMEFEKAKHFPKKSDFVAEPVILEEEAPKVDDILSRSNLSKFLGKKFDGDRQKTFRSGGRRRRRQRLIASQQASVEPKVVSEIKISKDLPLFEVASMMGKSSGDVILALFKKGMVCNRNNIIPVDTIRTLAEQFGIAAVYEKEQKADSEIRSKIVTESKLSAMRWPVVVVMGHVDHGKTTLLDYIRKMNVAGSEKGGITQHLGAYEVDSKHGKIIFIDTPGHEAFYHMRERGAKITDMAILVVAADDGIKPQTVEAINHAKTAGVPIIVAINKIDKMQSPAAIETIKRQLVQYDLMPEDWGGNVIVVPISAKTGQGVGELLEMVVLQSQMMDLKADATVPAKAFILEAKTEKGLGPIATVICSDGTLKVGDYFICGTNTGKVRLLINGQGKRLSQVGPSIPVQVVGFDTFASAGEWLNVIPQAVYAKAKNEKPESQQKNEASIYQTMAQKLTTQSGKSQEKVLNLVIKSDTRGSIDALMGCIQKLAKLSKEVECPIRVVYSGIGDVSEGDVELAENTNSLIIAFYVKPEKNAALLAKNKNIDIKIFHIIYHLVEELERILESKRKIETVWKQCGEATVKKIFDIKGIGVIAGCYMRDGVLTRGNKVKCMRDGREIGSGKVVSLQRDKKTVKEIHAGYECGFTCEGFTEWAEGDTVLCFAEVKQTPNTKQ